jgi:hypothetical protein
LAYSRIIELIDTDGTTLLQTLSNGATSSTVKEATFSLLRKGGCAEGSFTLTNPFTTRDITPGMSIRCKYDSSTTWYLGRVEEVEWRSPSEANIRTYGWFSFINEIQAGGYGPFDVRKPERYGKSDFFRNDPDHDIQTWYTASQPNQVIQYLYDNYINPESPIGLGSIEVPDIATSFESMTVRGEESISQLIRTIGMIQRDASFGVDASGNFFFKNKRDYETSLKTYQEGVDLQSLSMSVDRSLMFNQVLITGSYVYGADTPAGFYRFVGRYQHNPSISAHGYRMYRCYVPWIRTERDALNFCHSFFDNYAGLTTRYTFKTIGQDTLYKPWDGRITLLDAAGNTLAFTTFDRVEVQFNEVPIFTYTLGPEEPQFPEPPEPQRWENEDPNEPGDRPDIEGSLTVPGTWSDITQSFSEMPPDPSSSNTPPPNCKSKIGGRPLNYYPGYALGLKQALIHNSMGCVEWINIEECSAS